MPRLKNIDWDLPEGLPKGNRTVHQPNDIHSALLMDLRDELRMIREVLCSRLNCPQFLEIPITLQRIARNTAKPKKRKRNGQN